MTEPTDLAWGDRVGRVRDPLGNIWWIQERIEEPTPEVVAERFADPAFTAAMEYVRSTLAGGGRLSLAVGRGTVIRERLEDLVHHERRPEYPLEEREDELPERVRLGEEPHPRAEDPE